jgi:adenine-specific DNA-methyltransferase
LVFNSKTEDKIAICDYDIVLAKTSNNVKELYEMDENLVKKGYEIIRPPKARGILGCWTWSPEKFNDKKT